MNDRLKEQVGKELAQRVRDGDCIGLGTGSTVEAALQEIGKRVSGEGLSVHFIPTSLQSAWLAEALGLSVLSSTYRGAISWGFDGADEVDAELRIIKGAGGALLQEKILAARCEEYIVIIDEGKLVKRLGENLPIPVETIPEAVPIVEKKLMALGANRVVLRQAQAKAGPVITEAGNVLLDAKFNEISDTLEGELKQIVGVVESGLFLKFASEVLVAGTQEVKRLVRKHG